MKLEKRKANFKKMIDKNTQFEIIACIIVFSPDEKKIILCKDEKNNAYFLPGISAAFGQEIRTEVATYLESKFRIKPKEIYFLGLVENIFDQKEKKRHQYNLFFKIEDHSIPPFVPKNDCNFEWQSLPLKPSLKFQPSFLKNDLFRWLKGKEAYFSSTQHE